MAIAERQWSSAQSRVICYSNVLIAKMVLLCDVTAAAPAESSPQTTPPEQTVPAAVRLPLPLSIKQLVFDDDLFAGLITILR